MAQTYTGSDVLQFVEEDDDGEEAILAWKVLIVDDEEDIHAVTELLLKDFRYDQRPLRMLHAYTGEEGRELAAQHPDIALAFIDVVMETEDAGLQLVRHIREELKNKIVSIVLRTGQPGMAPETTVIRDYAINDFREKTELTATRMFTVTYAALKAHKALYELDQTNRRLQQSISSLEQFNYMVTHDLKTPLMHISTLTDYLEEDCGEKLGEEGQEHIRRMKDVCRQAYSLVEGLLALARIDISPPELSVVDSNEALENALLNLSDVIEAREAVVEKKVLPCVYGNAVLLTQLFQNLIGNALKFQVDSVPVVRITGEDLDDRVRICIEDQGIGIPAEFQDKIFDVFSRAHSGLKIEGTGIGLAICKKIVDIHRGRIWVQSVPGEGSTFFLEIPVAPGGPALR